MSENEYKSIRFHIILLYVEIYIYMKGSLLGNIINFLREKDLIYIMVAVYIGTILNNFLSSFTNSIIIPLIGLAIPENWGASDSVIEKLEDLGFVEMRKLLTDFISLLIAVFVSYYLIKMVLGK